MQPLFLVDASIYIFRSYYSIPTSFFASDGELNNAVYGYTQFLLDLVEKEPELISVAFDESLVSCYRNEIYPLYKANRELPDDNLRYQIARCQEITGLLGLHHLSLHDYEADDIIGTLLSKFGANRSAIIITRDKDLGQLLRSDDRLWDFASDTYTDQEGVYKKFGVTTEQLADFLALAGDTVDNIPGMPGIGAKTAAALLSHFGSLTSLMDRVDEIGTLKIRGAAKLEGVVSENLSALKTYRQITGIKCDVPMKVAIEDLQPSPLDASRLMKFCDEMDFGGRIRSRLLAVTGDEESP